MRSSYATKPENNQPLYAGFFFARKAVQALCFIAGANSIFYGDKLLTTGNPDVEADRALLAKLGMHARGATVESVEPVKSGCGCGGGGCAN